MKTRRSSPNGGTRVHTHATGVVQALVVALGLLGVSARPSQAQTFSVLYRFTGKADGGWPYGGLYRDAAGNLYGTTFAGGANLCNPTGCGVVFKIDTTGAETVAYNFNRDTGGKQPFAGLITANSSFYGTAIGGRGTVFQLDSSGHETALYSFTEGRDGKEPEGVLFRDPTGNFFGTTFGGGDSWGTVFKVDSTRKETVLHRFTGGVDGSNPYGGLVADGQGNLYGSTELGGDASCANGSGGCGVVFKLSVSGQLTALYSFTGGADGSEAGGTLVRDAAGNLYGTTGLGGDLTCDPPFGCGVVFKIDSSGHETVLHTFSGPSDGSDPIGALFRDASGNLYGTTYRGSNFTGYGTVFKLDPAGNETVLYTFSDGADGAFPYAGVIVGSDGNVYGTNIAGGHPGCAGQGCGVVFKIVP